MNPQPLAPEIEPNVKYSYADYLKWETEKRIELFKGIPFEMLPAPSTTHQRVSGKLFGKAFNFFGDSKCEVFSAPFDVRFPRKSEADEEIFTVFQPDICVICDLGKLDERGGLGAPDLVVEILSPGNSKREMREKFEVYEESGVREYWLVDYQAKTVLIYVLNETGKFIGLQPLTESETLTSTIFPELKIELGKVFEGL